MGSAVKTLTAKDTYPYDCSLIVGNHVGQKWVDSATHVVRLIFDHENRHDQDVQTQRVVGSVLRS